MYKVIGIDEAGKGPVLGSMFIGFSIIVLENGLSDLNGFQDSLTELGVKDSKLLSPKKRNEVYNKLKSFIDIKYAQLTPTLIDQNNFSGGTLHDLEIQAIVKILETEKPNLIIVDALTSNPQRFGEELKKKLSFETKIISENKADSKYPIVGAASIAAKELREQEVAQININVQKILRQTLYKSQAQTEMETSEFLVETQPQQETPTSHSKTDSDMLASPSQTVPSSSPGSGYPSDPKTKAFIAEHYDNKEFDFIFRKSWQTYKNIVTKNSKTLFDY